MKQTCEFTAETARTISGFIALKFRKSTAFQQKCEIIHHAPTQRRRSTAKGLNYVFEMPYPSASANNKINRELANIYDRTKMKRKILIIHIERVGVLFVAAPNMHPSRVNNRITISVRSVLLRWVQHSLFAVIRFGRVMNREHHRLPDECECWQQYGVNAGINKVRFASCVYYSINHVVQRAQRAKGVTVRRSR